MLHFIIYCALLVCLIYVGVIYASSPLVLLAFAGMILMAAAYVYLAMIYFSVRCSLVVPIGVAERNQPVDFEVMIENRSILPVTKVKLRLAYELLLAESCGKIRLRGMADASGKASVRSRLVPAECGSYRIALQKIEIYDLTGIFCLSKRQKKETVQIHVMPEIEELPVYVTEASRNFAGEADTYDSNVGGDDVSEIFQIRPFRDGDRLQGVHWKMSAKTEELMVRENSLPLSCPVVLLLDITGKGKIKEDFYRLALSISYSLMLAQCPHFAAWYCSREKDVLRVRIGDEESLYLFLLMLYEETKEKKEQDIKTLYREKYKEDFWITDIYVNQECLVKVNDKLVENPEDVELVV